MERFDGAAEGNAVVVAEMLAAEGHEVSARTLQRLTFERRRALRAAAVASVRFEPAPRSGAGSMLC